MTKEKNQNGALKFDTFTVDENDNINIENIKNFELWVLCSTAVGYLNKSAEIAKTAGNPESFKGDLLGYMAHAGQHIFEIANTEAKDCENPILRPMADRLVGAMMRARDIVIKNPSRIKVGAFEKEFWWFYSLWVNEFIDSVVIPTDSHKPIKGDPTRFRHQTKVVCQHGESKWNHSVRLEDDGPITITNFFNGNRMAREESYGIEPEVNEEENIVDYVLMNIAMWTAADRCFDFVAKKASQEPKVVADAKLIAEILGGDYMPYLLTAKHFKDSLNDVLRSTLHSKHEAAALILSRELRVNEREIRLIVAALT